MLERLQSTLAAIKNKLLRDELIRKLLINDFPAALHTEVPELSEHDLDKYIVLRPVFDFENKKNYNQNSVINMYITDIDPIENTKGINAVIQINVVCNQDVWNLDENQIRPLVIADRIITLINNVKFTASNKIFLNSLTDLIINKKMFGYALLFTITDGSADIDKF